MAYSMLPEIVFVPLLLPFLLLETVPVVGAAAVEATAAKSGTVHT